jgi:transcription initiation factor TFIIIB Brf1 subunit/transcription initiation factor TFIIB
MPSDTELFSEQWGAGLKIDSRGASYEVRRMAKISFHSSMNHRDRSLFHAYKDIETAARDGLNLSSIVIRDAKVMYKKFNGEKLTRGAVRLGIKANCVFMACQLAKVSWGQS